MPGGDAWMAQEDAQVSETVNAMITASHPVAAICAATLALAHAGLLNDRDHTSNGNGFLRKHVPKYTGEHLYRAVPAVSDQLVITANGLAPFAFAAEVFRTLAPDRNQDIQTYESLYSRGILD